MQVAGASVDHTTCPQLARPGAQAAAWCFRFHELMVLVSMSGFLGFDFFITICCVSPREGGGEKSVYNCSASPFCFHICVIKTDWFYCIL